jgi:hypothetical protein
MLYCTTSHGQETQPSEEFGPVVRAYLGYLNSEQEVVDDRASRHEISPRYYRRNSNRIRALRQMALNIARESGNDYLPELEAAARDEFKTLFDKPPNPRTFRAGQVLDNTYRFLGTVRTGETFYVFARLDPYEKAELTKKEKTAEHTDEPRTVDPQPSPPAGKETGQPRTENTGSP